MPATIIISPDIHAKISGRHAVSEKEVAECFQNKCGVNLVDDREDNRTDPPTLWFIAETNKGRILKIVYVFRSGNIFLKSAYEPSEVERAIYEDKGK